MTPQEQIDILRKELDTLKQAFYLNNFYATQDFNKYSKFNTALKVPHYSSAPSVNDVGQIIEMGGKLYISTAVDTWTLVGSQV